MQKVEKIIELLIKWRFVKESEKIFKATRLGERVDKLYIDPFTAWHFVSCLMRKRDENGELAYLLLISRALEMKPLPSLNSKEFDELVSIAEKERFFEKTPEEWDEEFEDFIKALKLAIIFKNWINEKTEAKLLEEFRITPGELRARLDIADWLLYSAYELSKILHLKKHKKQIKKLRIRMKYGIKEELLHLISLKGIGRIRARKLYNHGIKNVEDIRKTPLNILENIIGRALAKQIKEEVEKTI
jgi:helicase